MARQTRSKKGENSARYEAVRVRGHITCMYIFTGVRRRRVASGLRRWTNMENKTLEAKIKSQQRQESSPKRNTAESRNSARDGGSQVGIIEFKG